VPSLDQVLSRLGAARTWQEELYLHLDAHPELSLREENTRALVAARLSELGYEVRTLGGGVVGILANGPGPVVLSLPSGSSRPSAVASSATCCSARRHPPRSSTGTTSPLPARAPERPG